VNTTLGTKAPYYGTIAVVTFLDDLTAGNVSIADMKLGGIYKDLYAAYVGGRLERIAAIQLHAYNYTGAAWPRPGEKFTFKLPQGCGAEAVSLQRLMANGCDAITGITFDGYSYNYELEQRKSMPLRNVTRGDELQVTVDVPWSSAVIQKLQW
jgi:Glycosyl hydrolase family 79 C-terminal beta domain